MAISKSVKNGINLYWLDSLSSLRKFTSGKFYRMAGPVIIGIELIKLPRTDDFVPIFVMYPLYGRKSGEDIKECLRYPDLEIDMRDQLNFPIVIPYHDHMQKSDEAILWISKNLPVIGKKDVQIQDLLKIIDLKLDDKIVKDGQIQPKYFSIKYYISLIHSKERANEVLKEIYEFKETCDMERFQKFDGDFDLWVDQLQKLDRNHLLEIIKVNSSSKELKKIVEISS